MLIDLGGVLLLVSLFGWMSGKGMMDALQGFFHPWIDIRSGDKAGACTG